MLMFPRRYQLTAYPDATDLSGSLAALNGKELQLGPAGSLPPLTPVQQQGEAFCVLVGHRQFLSPPYDLTLDPIPDLQAL